LVRQVGFEPTRRFLSPD